MNTTQPVQVKKLVWIFMILGATLLLAGSVFGVDWTNYFKGTTALYPAIGKPFITLLAMVLVLGLAGTAWATGIGGCSLQHSAVCCRPIY